MMLISGVFANDYSIKFDQVSDKLVVRENNLSSYVSSVGLDKTNEGYYFIKRIEANENYGSFVVKLNLDEGVIATEGMVFPRSYQILSNGRTISFVWNYTNVSKGDVFSFFVSLEDKNNNFNYLWVYLLLAMVFLGVLFFGFKYSKNKRKEIDKYLLDEEKKVIQLLKQAEGKGMWQKNIQDIMGFSKAKLSRMVRNLESRGLIEKIPIGNTNKIRLK